MARLLWRKATSKLTRKEMEDLVPQAVHTAGEFGDAYGGLNLDIWPGRGFSSTTNFQLNRIQPKQPRGITICMAHMRTRFPSYAVISPALILPRCRF